MKILIRPITKLLYWMLILVAVVIGALRLGFAHIDYFKSDIEALLKQSVLPGLSFSDIELDWKQFDHRIHVRNATLTLPNQTDVVVIKNLSLEVSLWRSLLEQSLVVHRVTALVDSLHFRKDQEHEWWLSNIALSELFSAGDTGQQSSGNTIDLEMAKIVGFAPKYIHIDILKITIDDEPNSLQHEIENTVFEMQHRRGVVQTTLTTNFLSQGGQLSVQGIYRKGKGLIYSRLDRLNLKIARLIDIKLAGLQQAEVNGEIWLNLDDKKTPVIQADISIRNGKYQVAEANQSMPFSLDTRLILRTIKENWSVIGRLDELHLNDKKSPGFDFQLALTKEGDTQTLLGWVNKLDLSILASLDDKALPAEIAKKVEHSQLQGELSNIWFSINPTDVKNLSLSANFNDITNKPVSGIPGFNHLSGAIAIGKQNLQIETSGEQLTIDFAEQFRAPFELERYKLQANASFNKAGAYVSIPEFSISNNDINLVGRLLLDFDQADAPAMYLRASFDQGNAASKSKYLPVKLLPSSALRWLDDGIKEGEVSSGNLLYHGRLKRLRTLEENKSGEFYVDFNINKALVMFDPDWPRVEDAQGIITFHNLGMTADLSRARFDQIENAQGQVTIADLSKLEIDLDLHTKTDAAKAMPTWLALPISQSFRKVGSNFKNPKGQVAADLKVTIPLRKLSNSKVNVDLKFDNASVNAAIWDVELRQINGHLKITKDHISGKGIKAHYFDDPVIVDVETNKKSNKTIIQAKGAIKTQQLMSLLPDYMSKPVIGKSDWQIKLEINNKQSNAVEPMLRIEGQSDLKNTRFKFPAPLKKSPELAQKTKVVISLNNDESIDFGVRYGEYILARGDLEPNKNGGNYQLESMDIALSTSLRSQDQRPGVSLYGSLPEVSVDDWLAWYQAEIGQQDSSKETDSSDSGWNMIKFVDLTTQSALVQKRRWSNVNLILTQETDNFLAEIKSSHLTGLFSIPKQQSVKNPIVANLDYVKFETLDSTGPVSTLLPADFYNLSVTSKSASYNDYDVEKLKLEMRLNHNTVDISLLNFQRDKIILQSKGNWQYNPTDKTHVTSFDFTVNGSQFGETMAALGLGDAIKGGKIKLDSQLSWSDGLLNFDWNSLKGNASLVLDDGVLKDVEPGSARLIGLLSLNALPRRLLFGFSDVVGTGMEFDQIAGSYVITGENLTTSNTQMDGPSAKVLITGTTALRKQTYDQKMVITPKVRQTLPLIGGIAAGSAVGWGLLLVQKIFKSVIDKTVEIKYTIKGAWDDPKIVLVETPKKEKEILTNDK